MLQLIAFEDDINQHEKIEQIIEQIISNEENEKLFQSLMAAYLKIRTRENLQYITIKKQDRTERIFLNHVRYFVSDRRKIKAVFESPEDSIEFYMKMQDIEDLLKNAGFLRCHQSYLVNIHQILYWDNSTLVLTGNEKIPISRKYKEEVCKQLEDLS